MSDQVQKFQKRPVVIEAMQWHGDRGAYAAMEPVHWMDSHGGPYRIDGASGALYIVTLEGEMRVDSGDWIIRGVQGEFYPCKPDIFEQTYQAPELRPLRLEFYETFRHDAGPDGALKVTQFWWRVRHTSNGEIVAQGEGYSDRRDRDHIAALLHPDLEPVEVEK